MMVVGGKEASSLCDHKAIPSWASTLAKWAIEASGQLKFEHSGLEIEGDDTEYPCLANIHQGEGNDPLVAAMLD